MKLLKNIELLRLLLEQQQYQTLCTECLGSDQQAPAIQVLLTLAYLHLEERVEAEQWLQQALAHTSTMDAATLSDLGAVYILRHQLDQAVTWLQQGQQLLERVGEEDALLLARLGWCRMQQRDLLEARRLFQRSAALNSERLAIYFHQARLSLLSDPEQGIEVDLSAAQQALQQGWSLLHKQGEQWPETLAEEYRQQLELMQLEVWVGADQITEAEQWLQQSQTERPEEEWVGYVSGVATLLASKDRHAEADQLLREGLNHYPNSVALHQQLAELAQLQGHTMQAIQLLHRAIQRTRTKEEQKPELLIPLWCALADAAQHSAEGLARKAAEEALELAEALEESDALPLPRIEHLTRLATTALAQVESQAQNYAEAEQHFNKVLEENPYSVPALRGLGQQKMQCGEIDEAIALYERVREIDPVSGYSALINARQFPEDEETLEKIERAARLPSLQGSIKSGILFQLAAAWEKRKRYDRAMGLADEANRASRKLLEYDPVQHRNACARTRYAFGKALYEHRPGCGVDSTLPVFVLGMPRSGTTLVEQIIAGHSEIFGAGELGIIPSRIQGLNRWERHVGSGRSYPDCIDDLNPYVTAGIANGILDELKSLAEADKPNAKHVVDKLPHNFENIGLIKFLFPNARIISVRRDPRDIALSNYFTDYQAKHGGMGFSYELEWIGQQLADHNLMMHHWSETFPEEILEVHYEDVVEDAEREARRILEYIGVAWEPQVLAFNKLDRPVKTASVWQVRQPIYKSSKAKWRRYEQYLAPLIRGTNAKIEWEPIEMITLPEPGMLSDGVALYNADKLDEAEYRFKQLLHHIPDHAAAKAMVGIIYARKGHLADAVALLEKAHERCPWKREWRQDLIQAYEMNGELEKAEVLKQKKSVTAEEVDEQEMLE